MKINTFLLFTLIVCWLNCFDCKIPETDSVPSFYLNSYFPIYENLNTYIDAVENALKYLDNEDLVVERIPVTYTFYARVNIKDILENHSKNLTKIDRMRIESLLNHLDEHAVKLFDAGNDELDSDLLRKYKTVYGLNSTWDLVHFREKRVIDKLKYPNNIYVITGNDIFSMTWELYFTYSENLLGMKATSMQAEICYQRLLFSNRGTVNRTDLDGCVSSDVCNKLVTSRTHTGQALIERMSLLITARAAFKCYIINPSADFHHLLTICAKMYRESSYFDMNGFIAREFITQHISLCALRGHTEFIRYDWFQQLLQYQDDKLHCFKNQPPVKILTYETYDKSFDKCNKHFTYSSVTALTAGIRYIAYTL